MKVEFINHASVIIDCGGVRILTDPWYSGSVFNNGWNLIVHNHKTINDLDFDYLWYSHEHPDHFNVSDLLKIHDSKKKDIVILFQETKDKKLKDFCEMQGFNFLEMKLRREYNFGSASIFCGNVRGLDSWLSVSDGKSTLLNLNDCRVETNYEVDYILDVTGNVDILLTQYGSANWTGNAHDLSFKEISKSKVFERLDNQINNINPEYIIPFASFCWFSHEENYFCNDGVVTLQDFNDRYCDKNIVNLYLNDCWEIGCEWDSLFRLKLWKDCIDNLTPLHKTKYIDIYILRKSFLRMVDFLKEKNDWENIKELNLPASVVYLTDYKKSFIFDICSQALTQTNLPYGIKMSSESLLFLMDNFFGRGTLMVNGRFEIDKHLFSNFLKQTQIYYMNNLGKIYPDDITVEEIMNPKSFVFELMKDF